MIVGSCLGSEGVIGCRSVREGSLLVMWENLGQREGGKEKEGRKKERKEGRELGVLFVAAGTKSKNCKHSLSFVALHDHCA